MAFRINASTKINELVELYEEEDMLWNTSHEHYSQKDKRQQAFNRISTMLGIPVNEVCRKITNLRTYYSKELNKVKAAKSRRDEHPYISKWEYFTALDRFLYAFTHGKKSYEDSSDEIEEVKEEDADKSEEFSVIEKHTTLPSSISHQMTSSSSPLPSAITNQVTNHSRQSRSSLDHHHSSAPPIKKKRKCSEEFRSEQSPAFRDQNSRTHTKSSDAANMSDASGDVVEDRETVFGKHVANELRLIASFRSRQLVKLKIQQLLFEAQFAGENRVRETVARLSVEQDFPVLDEVDDHCGSSNDAL